jgi:glycerol-3-phosphate dehydrogenase
LYKLRRIFSWGFGMDVETVIFGGGAAGLWLLDELMRRRRSALLIERHTLGSGQTVGSQGIIHGGLKYTLSGLLTRSAAAIREMPSVWRDCLAGRREPRLTGTRIRSPFCYLWRTDSISSRLGMIGARFGLRVAPAAVDAGDRPDVLSGCPGTVARLDEQVIAPETLIADLADRHAGRLLLVQTIDFKRNAPGQIRAIEIQNPHTHQTLSLRPAHVVLTAGGGNAELRRQTGLSPESMQRRPLHMVLARGPLPVLNGHCVDGSKTRVTITSDRDAAGRTVWQIGGQIAEDGVAMDERRLVAHARRELADVIPGLDLSAVEWATYRVDRAERAVAGGARPDTPQVLHEGNVLTAWPTKLAFVPQLAQDLADRIVSTAGSALPGAWRSPQEWPRPEVARPPWETVAEWQGLDATGTDRLAA